MKKDKLELKLPLVTERLRIEEAKLEDAPFIFELLNSPTWLQYIGDRGISTLKNAERYIEVSLISNYRKNGFGLYKLITKNGNIPIGLCGFLKRDYLDHLDIGYALLPAFEGKGYAFEAAQTLLEQIRPLEYGQIILAITSPENLRSQNLLHRLGLNKQGPLIIEGENKEVLLFST